MILATDWSFAGTAMWWLVCVVLLLLLAIASGVAAMTSIRSGNKAVSYAFAFCAAVLLYGTKLALAAGHT